MATESKCFKNRPPKNITLVSIGSLTSHPKNPRTHSRVQIRAIAKSFEAFGVNAPILVDKDRRIIAGHGRWEAAKLLKYTEIPVVFLDHLSENEAIAYMLADNKLTDRSTWDENQVAIVLKELCDIALDFDVEATGFELPEIDVRVQSLSDPTTAERDDEFGVAAGPAVTVLGGIWFLGPHKICCGNALDHEVYETLFEGGTAAAAFTDPPYNVPIDGHVSGKGRTAHREFPMGVGEMSEVEFTEFLSKSLMNICSFLMPGALLYACMDWRHIEEMCAAGRAAECDFLNLCVWAKSNGGMGSLYRSRHELVFVFRKGKQAHINNVQLGRFGRNRTNVWDYAGANAFGGKDPALHPTMKPIGLVADAILDCTKRNDVILDPYLGSGTTLLAAERTGRRCYGIELDPLYVDTTIERWQEVTGSQAQNERGETYDQLRSRRAAAHD